MSESTTIDRELTIDQAPRNFGTAIAALKNGYKVSREGWNGKGMWLALQVPDEHSKMSLPYIYMKTADDKLVPWLASQTDVLAEDWKIIDYISDELREKATKSGLLVDIIFPKPTLK